LRGAYNSQMTIALNPSQASPYELFGGEHGVRMLVDAFYDHMDLDAEFAGIRALHPKSLDGSRDKLYWFLSGWMGGPSLYTDQFGHPRLRARHMPFAIGDAERDAWVACMRLALVDCDIDDKLSGWLMGQLSGTADWMRNKA
jgi:hemoglobin